uniref:Uncharacterized protein n=1 Tax=Cacopsylla melanoneura TaxID=428564 RepID=A0A8D8QU04_9HEMI
MTTFMLSNFFSSLSSIRSILYLFLLLGSLFHITLFPHFILGHFFLYQVCSLSHITLFLIFILCYFFFDQVCSFSHITLFPISIPGYFFLYLSFPVKTFPLGTYTPFVEQYIMLVNITLFSPCPICCTKRSYF